MLRLILAAVLFALPAHAQERRSSHCLAVAEAAPGIAYLHLASMPAAPEDEYTVRITYIDHSMFLIQTAGGMTVITDYNGIVGPEDFAPTVVTMNNAHGSHWTPYTDPRTEHRLEGWKRPDGAPAEYMLDLGEMLIRNVTTDIRGDYGGSRIEDNNSIFVFEVAGLCIGHLGHLHHEPSDEQYAALGRVDVLMAAVDGGMTVDIPTMVTIVERLRSSVILPMHWFSGFSLERFVAGLPEGFGSTRDGVSSIEVGLRTLPSRPTVVVLEPMGRRLD